MTTQHNKGGTKPRQRASKTDQRAQKGKKEASTKRDQANQAATVESASAAERTITGQGPAEPAAIEQAPTELAPIEQAMREDRAENGSADATLSGEVLPPEARTHVAAPPSPSIGLQTIAAAYVEYARKSWAAGRMLAERLTTTRSPEEAVVAQGDFARQTQANFLAHSQKLCGLYVEYTRQFFRPWEILATQWTRFGR